MYTWNSSLIFTESRNAYLLVWRVSASQNRDKVLWSVWVRNTALCDHCNYKVQGSLLSITWWWLISFTSYWVCVSCQWVWIKQDSTKSIFHVLKWFSYLNILYHWFLYCSMCACAFGSDVMGREANEQLQITALELCQSNRAVNHECELTPLLFQNSRTHVMSLVAHRCLRFSNEPSPIFLC